MYASRIYGVCEGDLVEEQQATDRQIDGPRQHLGRRRQPQAGAAALPRGRQRSLHGACAEHSRKRSLHRSVSGLPT